MTKGLLDLLGGVAGRQGVESAAGQDNLTAFELITVGRDGWPHVAWLGPGEVVPVTDDRVALALWPGSSTRQNLENGRAVLQVVINGEVHRLRLEVVEVGPVPVGERHLAGFLGRVEETKTDKVAYAEVLSGLTYRLFDASIVLERWAEQADNLHEIAVEWLGGLVDG
jgi:hypothetical protein